MHYKHSMLQNTPKPKTKCDSDLGVMSTVEAIKNTLLLRYALVLIGAKHCVEHLEDVENVWITQ